MNRRQPEKEIKIRLQTKFLIGVIILETFLMAIIVLVVENRMRDSVLNEFLKRGFSVARNLAAMNTSYLSTYNYVYIKQSVETIAEDSGFTYVTVLLFNGEIAGYSGEQPAAEQVLSKETIHWMLQSDHERFQYRTLNGSQICDFYRPH